MLHYVLLLRIFFLDDLSISYTMVTPAQFSSTNLDSYEVLYIGWDEDADPAAFSALNSRKSDIGNWVRRGGAIVALSECDVGYFSWLPLPVTIQTLDAEEVEIVWTSHPVMTDLSDTLLSYWGNSYHNYFTSWDPLYQVVVESSDVGLPVMLAAYYGNEVILITGQDPDYHAYYHSEFGAAILLINMLSYGCSYRPKSPVGGELVSGGLPISMAPYVLLVGAAGTAIILRKKRKL